MKNKQAIIGFLVGFAAAFSLGALSDGSVSAMAIELGQRIFRDRNNQIMIGSFSESGYWYFQGKIDAHTQDLLMLARVEETGSP